METDNTLKTENEDTIEMVRVFFPSVPEILSGWTKENGEGDGYRPAPIEVPKEFLNMVECFGNWEVFLKRFLSSGSEVLRVHLWPDIDTYNKMTEPKESEKKDEEPAFNPNDAKYMLLSFAEYDEDLSDENLFDTGNVINIKKIIYIALPCMNYHQYFWILRTLDVLECRFGKKVITFSYYHPLNPA